MFNVCSHLRILNRTKYSHIWSCMDLNEIVDPLHELHTYADYIFHFQFHRTHQKFIFIQIERYMNSLMGLLNPSLAFIFIAILLSHPFNKHSSCSYGVISWNCFNCFISLELNLCLDRMVCCYCWIVWIVVGSHGIWSCVTQWKKGEMKRKNTT